MSSEQNKSDVKAHSVDTLVMHGVTEYVEGKNVKLAITDGKYESYIKESDRIGYGRAVVQAESDYNPTEVDLLELLKWLAENKSEIYMSFVTTAMIRDYTHALNISAPNLLKRVRQRWKTT